MNHCLGILALGLCLCLFHQVNGEHLKRNVILKAVNDAKIRVDADYEYSRKESISRVKRNSVGSMDIRRLLTQPARDTRSAVRAAEYMENAIKLLLERSTKKHNIHKRSLNATDLITAKDLETIADLTGCAIRTRRPSCDSIPTVDRFRTATSVCNNRKEPRWGASNAPFNRWLSPEYEDGISLAKGWDPNTQINGNYLPLVREVSDHILRPVDNNLESDILNTNLVTFFGQWTDHDLTLTPTSPSIRSFNNGVNCDDSCERTEPCFPIKIPDDDPRTDKTCITFFRSAPACGTGYTGYVFGAANVRHQINALTSFIDLGQVYGSEDAQARDLRDLTNDKGLLRVNTRFTDKGRELLPFSTMDVNMCASRRRITNHSNAEEVPCFFAGDARSTENIALTSIHTLMMREHNRLARALAQLNPHWNGERIYQEARKIMGAYFQVFTFRDYLVHIVGPDLVKKQLSNYPGYDENVDPTIASVFATAAFRFAHPTIQPFQFRLDENYKESSKYPSPLLHNAFFTPWRIIFEGGLDPVVRGLVGRPNKLNTQNHILHDELREKLFDLSNHLNRDLGSLNMQRGRDHGIPGYNKWRGFCGLSQPKNLAELAVVMNNTVLAQKLLDLYGTPDNIDLWLGGVAEPFVPNGRVGPLLGCIITNQFQKIRQGDRFWWENNGVFTDAQKNSLRTASLARIICDNTGVADVPKNPFYFRARGSGYTLCKDIPTFDLSPWKENKTPGPPKPPGPPRPPGPQGWPDAAAKSAFAVRLGTCSPLPGQPIPFHEVINNKQKHYDPKTGVFTCVVPGVYEFQFHCNINQKEGNVDLLKNGKLVLHAFTTKQHGFLTATGYTLLTLKKGDKIWLSANFRGNGLTADSSFSGHLTA